MFDPDPVLDWSWHQSEMKEMAHQTSSLWAPLLAVVPKIRHLVGRVTERETGINSERPQDFVVCVLVVRSFRLTISALRLATSGYPDSVPNLARTLWEVGIRLLAISEDPAAAALGYLIHGEMEELKGIETEIARRHRKSLPVGNLTHNMLASRAHIGRLESVAQSLQLDPLVLRKKHGRVNVRDVCRRFGIEESYGVNYRWDSRFVHEGAAATGMFCSDGEGSREFILGPTDFSGLAAACDALRRMCVVLGFSGSLLEDHALTDDADRLFLEIDQGFETAAEGL